jgi:hypothetical protein
MAALVSAIALLLALSLGAARPAAARVHVFVGGVIGAPVYPYPPPAYYPSPVPAPYPYYPTPPPDAWAPGHWEWRYDAWGRPFQVWTPPYLR